MLVSDAAVKKQLAEKAAAGQPPPAGSPAAPGASPDTTDNKPVPAQPSKVRRFYGSVELDMVRPVKAFDAVLNAIVMELQRDAYKHAQGWRGGLDASGELRCAQGGQSICDAREAAYPRERARCRSPLLIICAGLRHG
jgi:hypothetical protein